MSSRAIGILTLNIILVISSTYENMRCTVYTSQQLISYAD